nr:uncharacterized protein LOC128684642 [Cherax quadricarinatus]
MIREEVPFRSSTGERGKVRAANLWPWSPCDEVLNVGRIPPSSLSSPASYLGLFFFTTAALSYQERVALLAYTSCARAPPPFTLTLRPLFTYVQRERGLCSQFLFLNWSLKCYSSLNVH